MTALPKAGVELAQIEACERLVDALVARLTRTDG